MQTLSLTNANDNKPVEVVASQVFYVRYSDAQKSTILVSIAGAYVPVKEPVDEVKRLLKTCAQGGHN